MVKFLICGNLEKNEDDSSGSAFSTLVKRVEALEKSSHGPFECLLVAGGLFQDERSYRESLGSSSRLPISTYAIDCPRLWKMELARELDVSRSKWRRGKWKCWAQMVWVIYDSQVDSMLG